ncbi:MAG: BolA family protein [Terricaulis silvestris]
MTDAKTPLSRASRIKKALEKQLTPNVLELVDESARHAGHAGAHPGGETHFRLRLVSSAFAGLSRIERQRLVNDTLREEFANGLHALSLDLKTPQEIENGRT